MLDENKNNLNSENLTEEKALSDSEINDSEFIEDKTSEAVSDKDAESKSTSNKATIDKTISEEVTTDSATADKTTPDKTTADKTASDKITSDNVATAKASTDKFTAEKTPKKIDYNKFDLEELVKEFQNLLRQETIPTIKNQIEEIKLNFNQKFGKLLNDKKESFLADGGNEIDFQYSNPIKSVYNDLLFEYKTKRESYYKKREQEQKENLSKRLELIEELKQLIDNAEPSTMYNRFRELQEKWRAIGKIPRTKYNDIWRTYHHHVERFYDLLHLSNDFRDLDFKHNLEEKLKLVTKAEELAESSDLNRAFKDLQVLHRLWKEEIGPVAREFREEIWERFSSATKKIHEKRHELQKNLESKYEDNVILKREVIEKILMLVEGSTIDSHKVWQQKIKELEVLRQEFFKIGKVPRALNEKIWKEFKDATRSFNRIKNTFYKQIKRDQQENLQKKNSLVEKAESLKDSEDWDNTTEIMKQIQAEWRIIGHVPRKYSDKIWKQFKDACNHYFNRLHNTQDEANKDQVEAFNKKKELLESLKSQANSNDVLTLEVINNYIDDWRKLGGLPNNMRHVEVKFNKTLNTLYSKLNIDAKDIAMLKFKNSIADHLANNNLRKIDNEQLFVRKKIDEITRETQQLENNVSFISNANDDNPLLKNVRDTIENYNKQLIIWKTKLDYLTGLDY